MTFDEIAKIHPFMKNERESDWHQHSNGGGWVKNTARVLTSVYVGEGAVVYETAQIADSAIITENARVFGEARVWENAMVSGSAEVYGRAQFLGHSYITEQAKVCGYAILDSYARIIGGTWSVTPTFINGTQGFAAHIAPGILNIFSQQYHVNYWLANFDQITHEQGYTEEEIAEYRMYLDVLVERDKQLFGHLKE